MPLLPLRGVLRLHRDTLPQHPNLRLPLALPLSPSFTLPLHNLNPIPHPLLPTRLSRLVNLRPRSDRLLRPLRRRRRPVVDPVVDRALHLLVAQRRLDRVHHRPERLLVRRAEGVRRQLALLELRQEREGVGGLWLCGFVGVLAGVSLGTSFRVSDASLHCDLRRAGGNHAAGTE